VEDKKPFSAIQHIISKWITPKNELRLVIYENLSLQAKYIMTEDNDAKRFLSLVPNNPEPILAFVLHKTLQYISFWEGGGKKMVIHTLEAMLDLWRSLGETAHLFVATCMLCSDKTVQALAAEIWIKGVNENSIYSEWIGSIIGEQEKIELAPLKRFTDLITSQMFMLSSQHNQALEIMLMFCIEQLPETPIKNTRRLLEIYAEILSFNDAKITSDAVIQKLNNWESVSSLKKVVKILKERYLSSDQSYKYAEEPLKKPVFVITR
jgi:hypothetical protein